MTKVQADERMQAFFLNQAEQESYEQRKSGTDSSEETSSSEDESMAQIEDGPKLARTDEERQTEEEPPEKRTRVQTFEDAELSEVWVDEVRTQVLTGMNDAAIRMHLSEGIDLADLDKRYSDTGKKGYSIVT